MSFTVLSEDAKYFIDFQHRPDTGTYCTIWEDAPDGEHMVCYARSYLVKPDMFTRLDGRKIALKRALDNWYTRLSKKGLTKADFKHFRRKVYMAMSNKMKMHEEDKYFKNGAKGPRRLNFGRKHAY